MLQVLFFKDAASAEIYTLSLHDALPIFVHPGGEFAEVGLRAAEDGADAGGASLDDVLDLVLELRDARVRKARSEEHTSELQSLAYLVCRLLLEKKKLTISSCTLASRFSL